MAVCVYSALAVLSSAAANAADNTDVDTPLPPIVVEAHANGSGHTHTQVLQRQDLDHAVPKTSKPCCAMNLG